MMGRLRRKFVLVAMISVTLVLAGMIAAINVANYGNVCSRAEERLELLVQGGGTFPQDERDGSAGTLQGDAYRPGAHGVISHSLEAPFETRYFTVVLDARGDAVSVNIERIAAVTEEDALASWRGGAPLLDSAGRTAISPSTWRTQRRMVPWRAPLRTRGRVVPPTAAPCTSFWIARATWIAS